MVSGDVVFTIAVIAFLIFLAVVVCCIVWLRHIRTDAYLLSHKWQPPSKRRSGSG